MEVENDILESGTNSIVYKEHIDGTDCIVKICRNPYKYDEWAFAAAKEDKMLSMIKSEHQLAADIPLMYIDNNQEQTRIIQSIVKGEPLSRKMYLSLPEEERKQIAKDIAEAMYTIHNLDINEVAATTNNGYVPQINPSKKNSETYFHGKYEEYIGALGKMISPETRDTLDMFIKNEFNQLDTVNTHVAAIHNDLRFSNIFYDAKEQKVGIVDFGGCEVNDIYHDFASIGLPNSLGFECQKDIIEEYNKLLQRDNKGYQISCETARAYSVAKMVYFAKMMQSSEKVRKTLFPESANGKIIGMEAYLQEAGIIQPSKIKENILLPGKHHPFQRPIELANSEEVKKLCDKVRKKLNKKTDHVLVDTPSKAQEVEQAWAEYDAQKAQANEKSAKLSAKEIKDYMDRQKA